MARLLAILWLNLGLWSGCAGSDSYLLIGGAEAASTAGVLEVTRGNTSTGVEIHLEFLPAPNQRQPDLTHYVVWFLKPEGQAIRAGLLTYEPRTREGNATFSGPPAPFELLITAEHGDSPAKPSEDRVLVEEVPTDS